MLGAFFVCAGLLGLVYAGYPLAVLLLARVRGAVAVPRDPDEWPRVVLFVPVHNEEDVIEEKLRNFVRLDYPPERVRAVVISDGSSDRTCAKVKALLSALDPEDASRIELIERAERCGKTLSLSEVAADVDADVFAFTDANAFFRRDALRVLVRHFGDRTVGLVCGRLRYVPDDSSFMTDEELYWRYEDSVKRSEGELGHLLVANGSIYAMRASLFRPMPGAVADDFAQPLLVASQGYRLLYEPAAVAEERLPAQGVENFRAKARIVTRGATALWLYHREVRGSGPLRVVQYLMHKVLRWLGGLVLVGAFVVSALGSAHPWLAAALTAQVSFYLLGFAAWLLARRGRVPGILRLPFYFLLVNAAALLGLWDFVRGTRRVTWEKSQSTRRSTTEVRLPTTGDTKRPGRPFSWTTALAVVGILLLAGGLGIEAGLRLTYSLRDGLRDVRGVVPGSARLLDFEVRDFAMPGVWRLRPGYTLSLADLERDRPESRVIERARAAGLGPGDPLFEVNRSGYKGPPVGRHEGARVLVLGDSCAFGSVFDRQSYPRRLEDELRAFGPGVEVVNGGVRRYLPAHVLARMEEWKALRPNLVVLCLGGNALHSDRMTVMGPLDGLYTLRAVRALRLRWERRGKDRATRTIEYIARDKTPDPMDPTIRSARQATPLFLPDVEELVVRLRETGSHVALLTLPSLYLSGRVPTPDALEIGHLPTYTDNPFVWAALVERYNEELAGVAARRGAQLVDVAAWSVLALRPRHEYFTNATFLNEDGEALMAAFVARELAPWVALNRTAPEGR